MRILNVLLSIVFVFGADKVTYHGHQVIRAVVDTREQADILVELSSGYDFWTEVGIGRTVDIRCPPENCSYLKYLLGQHEIQFSVLVENVQELVSNTPMGQGG